MALILPLFFTIFCLTTTSFARTVSKCELVGELRRHGFPEHQIKDFVCLVEAESSFQSHVKGGPNVDGSYDWGLYQINDRYWCNPGGSPGKGCNARCEDLRSDNISAATACAKKILAQQGIDAWVGWVNKCKGRYLPEHGC